MSLEVSGILKKIAKALEMGDGEIALNRFLYAYLGLKGAGPGRVSEADAKSGKIGVSEETWCMLQGLCGHGGEKWRDYLKGRSAKVGKNICTGVMCRKRGLEHLYVTSSNVMRVCPPKSHGMRSGAFEMDWDRYFQKYFGIGRSGLKDLVEAGRRLEKALSSEGRLIGDEAYTFLRYLQLKALERLEQASEPVPGIFYEVLRLYGVDIPLYIVPRRVLEEVFGRGDAEALLLLDHSYDPPRELAIALNGEYLGEGFKNIFKSRLRSLLTVIGWIVFKSELILFGETSKLELESRGFKGEELVESIRIMVVLKLERWVREQYRKLKAYMNGRMDGWKRGLAFEDVSRLFNPEIERFRELFRPLPEVYEGQWPVKIEEKKRPVEFIMYEGSTSNLHLLMRVYVGSADQGGEYLGGRGDEQ